MSRSAYLIKEPTRTGTGSLSAYTFDFKIESLDQLLVVERDTTGVETQRVRGTDTTYLSSVTFDAEDGGGTVNLAANLTLNYTIDMFLANDEPTQPSLFRGKRAFNPRDYENALDRQNGAIQRLAYLVDRCIKYSEHDSDTIDTLLPEFAAGTTDHLIPGLNAARTAWIYYKASDILNLTGGLAVANNLSDLASVATALTNLGINPYNDTVLVSLNDSEAGPTVISELTYPASDSPIATKFIATIQRGSSSNRMVQEFYVINVAGTPTVFLMGSSGTNDGDHGVTFTAGSNGSNVEIKYASDDQGAGNMYFTRLNLSHT